MYSDEVAAAVPETAPENPPPEPKADPERKAPSGLPGIEPNALQLAAMVLKSPVSSVITQVP